MTSVNFGVLDIVLVPMILNSRNILLSILTSTSFLEFVGFVTNPNVDSVPAVKEVDIFVNKVFLSVVKDFLDEHISRRI